MPLKKFFKISLSTNCFLSLMLFSLRYPPLCFRSPFFLLPYFSPALKTSTYWKPYHTLFFSPDPPCFLTLQNISRPTTLTLPKTLSQLLSLFPVFLQPPLSFPQLVYFFLNFHQLYCFNHHQGKVVTSIATHPMPVCLEVVPFTPTTSCQLFLGW